MNARVIVFVASRLLAIYLVVLHVLGFCIQLAGGLLTDSSLRTVAIIPFIAGQFFAIALYGLIALFFWIGAAWISKRIAAPFPENFTADIDFNRWQAVIIVGIGAMALLSAAQFAGQALDLTDIEDPQFKTSIRSAVVFAVFGVLLVAFPLAISRRLTGLRNWLSKPAIDLDKS